MVGLLLPLRPAPSSFLTFTLPEGTAYLSFTERMEGAHSDRARSAITKDVRLLPPLHPAPTPTLLTEGAAGLTLH